MRRCSKFTLLAFAAALFWKCAVSSTSSSNSRSYRATNRSVNDELDMRAVAWHVNDSVTRVYLNVSNDVLLYKRTDTSSVFFALMKVSYKLLYEPGAKRILDSGSVYVDDLSESELVPARSLLTNFKMKVRPGFNYYLEMEALDVNRKMRYIRAMHINRAGSFEEQNYLVTHNDSVAFRNYFPPGTPLRIHSAKRVSEPFTVDCIFKTVGPAMPPFSSATDDAVTFEVDSSYRVSTTDSVFSVRMPRKGLMHVRPAGSPKDGLTLLVFDPAFPGVSDEVEMIGTTRYIMSKEEYEGCMSATDKKTAIDKFWLNIGGSHERARELLKRYYSRVTEANKHFTSYTEGWKTDRGMIYIVFGSPSSIHRGKREEVWVYGNDGSPGSLRFVFNKLDNPLSDNDYVMERSPFYRDIYYSAVDIWRQGNVYNDNRR